MDFNSYLIFILLRARIIDELPENAALPLQIMPGYPTCIFSLCQVFGWSLNTAGNAGKIRGSDCNDALNHGGRIKHAQDLRDEQQGWLW